MTDKKRILVVDDEPQITRVLKTTLSSQGYGVRTASDGDDAVQIMKDWSPDLVITDLRMGNVDGLDLIRQVRESVRAALPIIIVSGDADVKDAIAAMHLSVVDFLLKPIDTELLLGLVKRELGIEP